MKSETGKIRDMLHPQQDASKQKQRDKAGFHLVTVQYSILQVQHCQKFAKITTEVLLVESHGLK